MTTSRQTRIDEALRAFLYSTVDRPRAADRAARVAVLITERGPITVDRELVAHWSPREYYELAVLIGVSGRDGAMDPIPVPVATQETLRRLRRAAAIAHDGGLAHNPHLDVALGGVIAVLRTANAGPRRWEKVDVELDLARFHLDVAEVQR